MPIREKTMADNDWEPTPKGLQYNVGGSPTQTGASSESGAAGGVKFGLAQAPGEDNDAYAKNYASDKAIY